MSKLFTFVLFVLFSSSVTAAEQWKDWTLHPESEQPEKSIRIENDQLIAEINSDNPKRQYHELSATRRLVLQKRKNHILYAVVEAEKAGEICFVYKHHDPYKILGLRSVKKLLPGENRILLNFITKECPADKIPLISIALGRINGKVTIKEFSITPRKELPLSSLPDIWKAEYNGTVKEVKAENGLIDFRKFFGRQPEKAEVVLTADFFSESYGVLPIGISADWWMEFYANGNRLLSTLDRGNRGPVSPKTHCVEVPILRGKNTVS